MGENAATGDSTPGNFYRNPRSGEVYNAGGSRFSNCSMLEAMKMCESITGNKMNYTYTDTNRTGDHIWYISDVGKSFRYADRVNGGRVCAYIGSLAADLCFKIIVNATADPAGRLFRTLQKGVVGTNCGLSRFLSVRRSFSRLNFFFHRLQENRGFGTAFVTCPVL